MFLSKARKLARVYFFDQHWVLFWYLTALFIGLPIGDLIFDWIIARTQLTVVLIPGTRTSGEYSFANTVAIYDD